VSSFLRSSYIKLRSSLELLPLWSVLESSQETLELISLPFPVPDEETASKLWKLHFPRLRSLTTGLWITGGPHGLVRFLNAHNETLEEVHCNYLNMLMEDDSDDSADFSSGTVQLLCSSN
jgi:hypothetical protein